MCNNQVAWRKGNGAKSQVLGSSVGSRVPPVPLRAQPALVHRSHEAKNPHCVPGRQNAVRVLRFRDFAGGVWGILEKLGSIFNVRL